MLLSRLCRQVGYEMYEMDISDRNLLLRELKEQFEQERFDELGEFLLDYVAQRLIDDDADTRDLREAQEWTALAYTKPDEAARELVQRLSEMVQQEDGGEVLRLASLVEIYTEPLLEAGFEPLLMYTNGIKNFVRENYEDAAEQLNKLFGEADYIEIAGIYVTPPVELELSSEPKPVIEEEQEINLSLEDIDVLVQEVRAKVRPLIEMQYNTMRVLDMTQPIALTREEGIYTNVNVLENVTGCKLISISELMQNSEQDDFGRFGLNRVAEMRVPGLEAVERYSKLMVLGKPGSGKTTFLKYLAMQCIDGKFQTNRVPLFITLKDFAEVSKKPDILGFIAQQFSSCEVLDATVKAEQLLRQGKALVLLDGLDEVRQEDTERVLQQIQDFSDQFYSNQFVITCRVAAKEYTFERFTDVEIADFNEKQIAIFAQNWFRLNGTVKAERFIQKLNENKPIQELASSPLLLTLLCLVFEEIGDFPTNIAELYQEGISTLLKKWDAKRNIKRDIVYKNLSLQRKEDLLSQIALTTFEKGNYFFKNIELEKYIAEYIGLLPDSKTNFRKNDSNIILKSIEAQHGILLERAKGIYSFSHITFHEFFAAKAIVFQYEKKGLQSLVTHITERRWQQVFLMVAQMLRRADDMLLLMKYQIDSLVRNDEKLQRFMIWLNNQCKLFNIPYKASAIRAEYFALSINPEQQIENNFFLGKRLHNLTLYIDSQFLSTQFITIDYALIFALSFNENISQGKALYSAIEYALDNISESELKQLLLSFKNQLPNIEKNSFQDWWQANGKVWIEELRNVIVKYRNIGHDWQFSNQQQEKLKKYYDANKLLVYCLNSDCYLSRAVHQEIEDSLFLPITEIEGRRG